MAQDRNEINTLQQKLLNEFYMLAELAVIEKTDIKQKQKEIKNFLTKYNPLLIKLSADQDPTMGELKHIENQLTDCLNTNFGSSTTSGPRGNTKGRVQFEKDYKSLTKKQVPNDITTAQLIALCQEKKITSGKTTPITQSSTPIQNTTANTTTSTRANSSGHGSREEDDTDTNINDTTQSIENEIKNINTTLVQLLQKQPRLNVIPVVDEQYQHELTALIAHLSNISNQNQNLTPLINPLVQVIITAKNLINPTAQEELLRSIRPVVRQITSLQNSSSQMRRTPSPLEQPTLVSTPNVTANLDSTAKSSSPYSPLKVTKKNKPSSTPINEEEESEESEELKNSKIQKIAQQNEIEQLTNNLNRPMSPHQPPPPPPRNGQKTTSFLEAEEAINVLKEDIEELEKQIEEQINDSDDNDDEDLLEKQRSLEAMQSTARQARRSLDDAKAFEQASQTQISPKDKLSLLNQAQQSLNQVVDTIDAANTPNNNKVNTLIIDEARRPGQTRLIQHVTDREKLANEFKEAHKLLPTQTTSPSRVTSLQIQGGDGQAMFRGQALGAHDVVQYTESVHSGGVIYSEIYQGKAGNPVATDRSLVTETEDMQRAAIIQAENILANYKGRGEIVITLDVKSKNKDQDLAYLNMLYAAILHCSKKSTFDFSSYPPIRVVHPDFKAPQLTRLGVTSSSRAKEYIATHLGGNPDGYLTHGDMSKQFKELRTHYKDILKTLTPGGGVDKGQVIAGKVEQQQLVSAPNAPHGQQKQQHQKQQHNNHSAMTPVQPIDNLYEDEEPPVIQRRNSF